MSKAFTKETDDEDERVDEGPTLPPGAKNYFTPEGYGRLKAKLDRLLRIERPQVVATVAWAAGNGDRSENGDYIYGKRRLREIDSRINFLTKRLRIAEPIDPAQQKVCDRVFFGATVTYADASGDRRTVRIVGTDEAGHVEGDVSWISPIARALMGARVGDVVEGRTPAGLKALEVIEIEYRKG